MIQILQGTASLALLALAIFFGYLAFALLPRLRATLGQIQQLIDHDVRQTVNDVDTTVQGLNQMMPKLDEAITHVNQITLDVENLTSERLDPIALNVQTITTDVQDITNRLQNDAMKIDETVTVATEFSKKTVELATFYRGKLFEPVVEIASLWSGLKAGFTTLKSSKNKKG